MRPKPIVQGGRAPRQTQEPGSSRRPSVLRATCACLVTLCFLSGCDRSAAPQAEDHENVVRNVVLICIDTVRYDSFRVPEMAGVSDTLTLWEQRAIRLERARATAPWTIPSVASTLTGLYPPQHTAGTFPQPVANLDEQVPSALPEEAMSLPEILRSAGWSTPAFVAHPWFKLEFGLDQGFSKLVLQKHHRKIVTRGEEWLTRHLQNGSGSPFFLYLHFMEAHEWNRLEDSAVEKSIMELQEPVRSLLLDAAPGAICTDPGSRLCRRFQAYVAIVMELRETVGTFLSFLEENDLLDRTLVILYSDHGEEFHDHRDPQTRYGGDPRGFFGVGHGQSVYEELLHIPLLVWHPESPGTSLQTPVSLVDVFPTILRATGLATPVPPRRLGRPLPTSPETERTRSTNRPIFASGISFGPEQWSVTLWPWKRIWQRGGDRRLLFNLEGDPEERDPSPGTADEDRVRDLDRLIHGYRELNAVGSADAPKVEGEGLETLKSLGYLGGVKGNEKE